MTRSHRQQCYAYWFVLEGDWAPLWLSPQPTRLYAKHGARQTQSFRCRSPVTWCSLIGFPAACPVLCSGNGQYSKGTCQCYSGWKGAECDVPMNQCIDPSCGGHGSCIDGNCVCAAGYKGEHCEEGKHREIAGQLLDNYTGLTLTGEPQTGFPALQRKLLHPKLQTPEL